MSVNTRALERTTAVLDIIIVAAAMLVIIGWLIGRPLLYSVDAPVMSPFTALSLAIMAMVRLARDHLDTWPAALSLAMTGLVLGGNVSSLLMLLTIPPSLLQSFSSIVVTSELTSVGLILFCMYDLLAALRETPKSSFIFDDIVLHLALVPGGLSLLGYLLNNPTYLSIGADPRVGISPLEMAFMATYAVSAVLANRRLFLWQFLAAGWWNRAVFALLVGNQFVAPLVVAWLFRPPTPTGPGIELYVLLAGVVATLSFLVLQARR